MLFDMLVGLLHRLTTPSGREGGQDCDGALSQAPIRSLPTRPDHLWMRLPDRADRSTQGHQVVRNRGQTLSGSTTIMLTVMAVTPAAHAADDPARIQERLVVRARVRAALVGVVQQADLRAPSFQSCAPGFSWTLDCERVLAGDVSKWGNQIRDRRRRRATGDAAGRGRVSARRKRETVLRLLRGEDLESVSRELGITAARASQWRDQFLAAGQASLKSRAPDAGDADNRRLQAKIGELLMENELLYAKVDQLEAGGPLARRRSRR